MTPANDAIYPKISLLTLSSRQSFFALIFLVEVAMFFVLSAPMTLYKNRGPV